MAHEFFSETIALKKLACVELVNPRIGEKVVPTDQFLQVLVESPFVVKLFAPV
jgi:hypothetical protein